MVAPWTSGTGVRKYEAGRKKCGIHSVIRRKQKKYNSSTPEIITKNKLCRDFYATAPIQKWVADITEFKIPVEKKKLYLCAILDLYDIYPISYVISCRNDKICSFLSFGFVYFTSDVLFHNWRDNYVMIWFIICYISLYANCYLWGTLLWTNTRK